MDSYRINLRRRLHQNRWWHWCCLPDYLFDYLFGSHLLGHQLFDFPQINLQYYFHQDQYIQDIHLPWSYQKSLDNNLINLLLQQIHQLDLKTLSHSMFHLPNYHQIHHRRYHSTGLIQDKSISLSPTLSPSESLLSLASVGKKSQLFGTPSPSSSPFQSIIEKFW